MVNFVYLKDGVETKVSVASSWSEVSFAKYLELVNKDEGKIENVISILSGVPVLDIINISADEFIVLTKVCIFVFDRGELLNHVLTPEGFENWNIGDEPWSKLEQCKNAIAMCNEQPIIGTEKDEEGNEVPAVVGMTPAKDSINAAAEIVKVYTGIDILDKPVLEAIGTANFFLFSCMNFTTDSKD